MRRPDWLMGWGDGQDRFEGSLIIDIPDVKVVEASSNKKLFLVAVGTRRKITAADEPISSATEGKSGTGLRWTIFYDSTIIRDFIPAERIRDFVAGAVAMSSGSAEVYGSDTAYVASGSKPAKGNAPLLLDHDLAKKIEEARKKRAQSLEAPEPHQGQYDKEDYGNDDPQSI